MRRDRLSCGLFRAMPVALGLMSLVSGCYTVDLSETSYPETRMQLRGGPGARERELTRIVRTELTHYTGERVSFGLMPGIPCMANDFGGMSGYVPATAMCLIPGPFVNAFTLGAPTLCALLVEPFTMTSEQRGLSWDALALGFVGAYRWRVLSHDERVVENVEDVLVDGGYLPDTSSIAFSRAADGKKVWCAYPGFAALMRDVERDGEVDVSFSDGKAVRRFRRSRLNPGCLSFEDRDQ